ncbi:chaperonin Cpn60/TCP-1 family [Tribonema minus]|uniref:CCT-theta n=1 Tax=Tribonema minus TaxID=303371 RepID=A0A835Z415_9STRA|nr:chaperonin Cpn60/TCP-1 family [Tribonema minus]
MAKSMGYNLASGLSGMLKEGHTSYEGVDEAIMRNIDAARQLADIVKSSLGPNGMKKLVVNHQGKIIVTSDGATIVHELDVLHPAAKMIVLASQMQEQEVGDGTSLVVALAGGLLRLAGDLLRQGLHTAEILEGYARAYEKCAAELPSLACHTVEDPRDKAQLIAGIRTALGAKQYGFEDTLAPFVAEACLTVMPAKPKKATIAVDNVRIAKLQGGSIDQCDVIKGMVILRDSEGSIKRVEDAKVTVFGCGIEASSTEAKGTVLIRTAEELMNYNKSEEKLMEEIIKSIADSGAQVVVANGSISEMALHYLEKYGLMVLKITSKWELRRLCAALRATALVRLGPATPDEMGRATLVEVREVGGRNITVVARDDEDARLATVVLRASTEPLLSDLGRAVDDGVQCARALCLDPRFVPGAGATEAQLAARVRAFADTQTGLDQYAIRKFAEALEVVPRVLCETSGLDATAVLARLAAAHAADPACPLGVDVEAGGAGTGGGEGGDSGGGSGTRDAAAAGIYDLLVCKESALRLAVDATLTVLRVDQIIMAKQAGGPKPK